ncbi:MAG: hypothetical protein K8L97_02900 [Anaerolineae bacterium]|nr:hypothetical protein [Anaerolineae bacterium]
MTSSLDQYPQRDGMYSILPDGVAVYNRYNKRVIMLDGLTSEIWLRADGKTSLRTIALDMAGWVGHPVKTMLLTAPMILVIMNSEGVMYQVDHAVELPYHLALPQEDQEADQTHQSMVAAGWIDQ